MHPLYHACGLNVFLIPFAVVDGVDRGLPLWWIAFMLFAWSMCVIAVLIETARDSEQ